MSFFACHSASREQISQAKDFTIFLQQTDVCRTIRKQMKAGRHSESFQMLLRKPDVVPP